MILHDVIIIKFLINIFYILTTLLKLTKFNMFTYNISMVYMVNLYYEMKSCKKN